VPAALTLFFVTPALLPVRFRVRLGFLRFLFLLALAVFADTEELQHLGGAQLLALD